jgi:acetylornithine aminotransferase
MVGIEFKEDIKNVRQKLIFEEKIFTDVAGNTILPPPCLTKTDATEFLEKLQKVPG